MGNIVVHKQQRLAWFCGVFVAWLLLLVPIWPAQAQSETKQQACVTCDSPDLPSSQSDFASMVCSQGSVARVTARPCFPFGASISLPPGFLAGFTWLTYAPFRAQRQGSPYSFRFLKLIFEHQIAINAP